MFLVLERKLSLWENNALEKSVKPSRTHLRKPELVRPPRVWALGGTKAPGTPTHTHRASGGCGAGRASQRQAQRDLAKPNFPPGSPGPPDTSTESIFRRAWKAPGFPGRGRAAKPAAARCGARARSPPRAALCAGCQRWWRPETHFGAPAPPAGAASPDPPASARRREQERGPGTPHGWRPRAASPPPPGPPSWPRPLGAVLPTGAGPSPGAGPRQARPARRAPCVPVAGLHGEGGGRGPRPAPGHRGGYLAIAAAASRKPRGGRGCGNSPVWRRRPPPEGGAQRWEPPSPLSPSRCRRRRRRRRLCKQNPETRMQERKVDLEVKGGGPQEVTAGQDSLPSCSCLGLLV
ncbi:cuticle collagen 2-like [Mustela erminea]|uniref:cuticle collagen 2-like n=1 Tax=Mustela erminea TaxID=36723 RepID=UPI0013874233|nr:cuticle collagen 2-like [Mustela erminea]